MILWVHMAPRGCFLEVVKSSDWDLFCGALGGQKSFLSLPGFHVGSNWIISGSFKTIHNFVIFDAIFAISKRCLTVTYQTSKVIEIQNRDQIQIRLIKLLMGKIVKSKIYV